MHEHDGGKPGRLLTFRSGGWVLLLTAALAVFIAAATLMPVMERIRDRPPGDGGDPTTYGFDLTNIRVPAETLVAVQLHREVVASLDDPPVMPAADVAIWNEEHRGKYVVPTDLVVGVTQGDESRAYPLTVLAVHENVNDTLGGRPLLVSYNPIAGSVAVYERATGGETLTFGTSGLVSNSNALLYDRETESLWQQFTGRAAAGPAVDRGGALTRVVSELTHWSDWLGRHPDTTILSPDLALIKRYRETNYAPYFRSVDPLFPVAPVSSDTHPLMAPCLLVETNSATRLYTLAEIAAACGSTGVWSDEIGGATYRFRYLRDPEAVTIAGPDGTPPLVRRGLWFVWQAIESRE